MKELRINMVVINKKRGLLCVNVIFNENFPSGTHTPAIIISKAINMNLIKVTETYIKIKKVCVIFLELKKYFRIVNEIKILVNKEKKIKIV